MIFNRHSDLVGKHAYLSASKPHWLNYDDEKLLASFDKHMTAARGTRLHNLAAELISLEVKMPNTPQTFNMYINDCIGYRMSPEQVLMYSYNAFGTADAISFRKELVRELDRESLVLRIFDLKNGVNPAKEDQLKIYAALFFLEYRVPFSEMARIVLDLRIYQHDTIYYVETDADEIMRIMDRIKEADELISTMKEV